MSNRLQVLMNAKDYGNLRKIAKMEGVSVGEWVRQKLRKDIQEYSIKDPQQKIKAIKKYSQYQGPIADIEQILAEIKSGYLKS